MTRLLLAASLAAVWSAGCAPQGGTGDAGGDGANDGARVEGGADAATDAAPDAAPDGAPDVAEDVAADVAEDAAPDAAQDVPGDAACAAPEMNCGGRCVDVNVDPANCGACGLACPASQRCTMGVCTNPCSPPAATLCAGTCVDLSSDSMNCGACGQSCPTGQPCIAGACLPPCRPGGIICAAMCVDPQTDNRHCGACGTACAAGQVCMAGACVAVAPPNDQRAGATMLNLMAPSQRLTGTTAGARNDTTGPTGCTCTSGNDVFYRFTLAASEIVYADTFGTTVDASLFLQDAMGNNVTPAADSVTCSDDACGGQQAQLAAVLPAGDYFLVVSGCAAGAFDLRFEHLPTGSGPTARVTTTTGTQTLTGATAGTGRLAQSCAAATGPENAYYFTTCPGAMPVPFHATTCGGTAAFDTVLEQRTPSRMVVPVCNDDYCATRSSITSELPAAGGLHALYVDGFSATAAGAYTARVTFGACTAGFTLCGATCRDLAADSANCGACGTACTPPAACRASACTTAPANDACANAQTIALRPAGETTITMGTTAGAAPDPNTCNPGPDVFYRFTLAARELVHIDTFGSPVDTVVGLIRGDCAQPVGSCSDDACPPRLQSQIAAVLDPGTYVIAVDTFDRSPTGVVFVNIQHLPVSNQAPTGTLAMGASTLMTNTAGAPTRVFSCPNAVAQPERYYLWTTCPSFVAAPLTADTCAAASYDTVIEVRSTNGGAMAASCNDDYTPTNACGAGTPSNRSRVTRTIPAGVGAHILSIGGYNGASGTATVTVSRP